ncbi:MAG: hypothetical protein ABI547_09410, partial [Betaproteobacteria bacterium]
GAGVTRPVPGHTRGHRAFLERARGWLFPGGGHAHGELRGIAHVEERIQGLSSLSIHAVIGHAPPEMPDV